VNELTALKCSKRAILEKLLVTLSPFAPHISEELWHTSGNTTTICDADWIPYEEKYLVESIVNYAISFNGRTRFNMELSAEATNEQIEKAVLEHELTVKWLEGKMSKKIIIVPKKIVNVVF
jgi:leucyl-tRNA synthetase